MTGHAVSLQPAAEKMRVQRLKLRRVKTSPCTRENRPRACDLAAWSTRTTASQVAMPLVYASLFLSSFEIELFAIGLPCVSFFLVCPGIV